MAWGALIRGGAAFLGRSGRAGGRALGGVVQHLPAAGSALSAVNQWVPQLEDEAVVEVVGQPGANKKDLYYLAMAAACGLVRRYDFLNSVFPPLGMVMIEYDAADNWVRARIRYKTSLLSAVANNPSSLIAGASGIVSDLPGIGSLLSQALDYLNTSLAGGGNGPMSTTGPKLTGYAEAPIFKGPSPSLIGKNWNFTGKLGVGLPGGIGSIGVPDLPFAERTILTTDTTVSDPDPSRPVGATPRMITSENPHPPGDFRSRGAVVSGGVVQPGLGSVPPQWTGNLVADLLVPLVFSALTNPGSADQTTFSPPTEGGG